MQSREKPANAASLLANGPLVVRPSSAVVVVAALPLPPWIVSVAANFDHRFRFEMALLEVLQFELKKGAASFSLALPYYSVRPKALGISTVRSGYVLGISG